MDFLNPKKKRQRHIRLWIGYGLLAVAISLATLIMLLQVQGYGVDRDGNIVQNGLLFSDSHPVRADLYINDQYINRVPQRRNMPAGEYTVEMRSEGYRTWRRDIRLSGGGISRLVYAFLFPETLKPEDAQLYAEAPLLASQSPDRHWLLVQVPRGQLQFELVDLASANASTTSFRLPNNVLTSAQAASRIEVVEWSTDNRHVLIKRYFNDQYEFIVLDTREPQSSLNISRHFNQEIKQLALRDKKFDQFYFTDSEADDLYRGSLNGRQVDRIARSVSSFKPHGDDMILYVTNDGASSNEVSRVMMRDGDEVQFIRELPKGSKYLIDLARYEGRWYVVAGQADDKKVYVYSDPQGSVSRSAIRVPLPTTVLQLDSSLDWLSFSANARFISVQSGRAFRVLDLEDSQQFKYKLDTSLRAGQMASWMDGHRLAVVGDGELVVFDFDGSNQQSLVAAHQQFEPFFDRDYEILYTLSPSLNVAGRSALVRTPLTVTD